jgi:hypothetical protein
MLEKGWALRSFLAGHIGTISHPSVRDSKWLLWTGLTCGRTGDHAARCKPRSCSTAVPLTCPNHRSVSVIHGQQRAVITPAELYDQPSAGGRRELPQLAVPGARIDLAVPDRPIRSPAAEDRSAEGVRDRTGPDSWSVLGPWRTGTIGAGAVTNGHQGPRGTAGRPASSSGSLHDASRQIRLWSRRSRREFGIPGYASGHR